MFSGKFTICVNYKGYILVFFPCSLHYLHYFALLISHVFVACLLMAFAFQVFFFNFIVFPRFFV